MQDVSCKWLLFVYICVELTNFYSNCEDRYCYHLANKTSNKYLFYILMQHKVAKNPRCSVIDDGNGNGEINCFHTEVWWSNG